MLRVIGLSLVVAVSLGLAVTSLAISIERIGEPFAGFSYTGGPTTNVGVNNRTSWPGLSRGLEAFDHIQAANGKPIRHAEDLTRLVRSLPVGTPVTYQIKRGQQKFTVTVPTQQFELDDFFTVVFPGSLTGFLFLLVGTVTFALRPRRPAAQGLLLCCVAVASSLLLTNTAHTALLRALIFADWSMGATALIFAAVFPTTLPRLNRHPALAALLFIPSVLVATRLVPYSFPLFAAWSSLGFLTAIGRMTHSSLRSPDPLARAQSTIVLLGLFLGFTPALILFLIPIMLSDTVLTALNPTYATVLFPLAVAYAVLRHRLFDIEIAIKKTLVYSVVTATLAGVYAGVLTLIQLTVEPWVSTSETSGADILATVLVVLLFTPLRDRVKAFVDARFYRTGYDFAAVVSRFGETVQGILDESKLARAFLRETEAALHPRYAAVLTRPGGTEEMVVLDSAGLETNQPLVVSTAQPQMWELISQRVRMSDTPLELPPLTSAWVLPLWVRDELVGTVLLGPRKSEIPYRSQDRALLVSLCQQLGLWLKVASLLQQRARRADELQQVLRLYEEANLQAMTDPLTGLQNRRAFESQFTTALAGVERYNQSLALVVCDIDYFKQINDTLSHAAGDDAIQRVADVISQTLRASDFCARWGGDEFVMALPHTPLDAAQAAADRIRTSLAGVTPIAGATAPRLTLSLGVTSVIAGDSLQSAFERADRALYLAKAKGRNRCQALAAERNDVIENTAVAGSTRGRTGSKN